LTPRFIHPFLGIHYTGMTYYEKETQDEILVTSQIEATEWNFSKSILKKKQSRRGSVN